ncbi:MAG: hypothetical protein JNK64_39220 [Myxococcales bacterium]|nr:hypothetical protein [Myxococcales bacterium]
MRLRIAWASLCTAAALAACTPPPTGPLARAGGTGATTTGTTATGAATTGTTATGTATTTDAAGTPDPTEAPRSVPMVGECRAGQTWGCAPCVADSTDCPCACVGAPGCPAGEALLVVADTVGCGRPTAVCHRTTDPAVFVCDRRPPPPPVPNRVAPADVRCTATPTGWEQRNLLRRADTPDGMPPSPTGVWCDLQGDGEHWGPRPDTPAAGPGRSAGYFCQVVKGSPDHGKVTCWRKDEP